MPIYEYQCGKCEKVHEIWHKITEEPVQKCPDCKGKMSRLISSTAFSLKGSGWYKTDYERKKTPAAGDSAKSETSEPSDKAPKDGDKSKKSEKSDKSGKSEKSDSSGKDTSGHGSKEPSGTKSQAA